MAKTCKTEKTSPMTPAEQEAILLQLDKQLAGVPEPVTVASPAGPTVEELNAAIVPAKPAPKKARKAANTSLAMTDVLAALYPEGSVRHVPTMTLTGAIALLSRPVTITSLPAGSHFSLDGRFGTLVEMAGQDAKVEWDGKTLYWASGTEVRFAAELPVSLPKAERRGKAEQATMPASIAALNRTPELVATPRPPKTPKAPKVEGPSRKTITYEAWLANPAVTPEELHILVKGELSLGTIRGRLKAWAKGVNLPASHKTKS